MTFARSVVLLVAVCLVPVQAQYHQSDFPAEEFRARHARVFEQIGANAVAVVQGVGQTEGFTLPRQHNTFYYLRYEDTVVVTATGVENFTDFLPSALDDMERLVRETGVVQKVPAIPASAIKTTGR